MPMVKKLEYSELLYDEDIQQLGEIKTDEPIGQERALKALKFGLDIKKKGYNIFAVGRTGCGRTDFARKAAEAAAAKEAVPPDICYVYNFRDPRRPLMLEFSAGQGEVFKAEISELMNTLTVEIPKAYATAAYEKDKEHFIRRIQSKRDNAVKQINDAAREQGFSVKNGGGGLTVTPIIDGKVISDDEYDSLSEEVKEEFGKKTNLVMEMADEYIKEARDAENEIKKEIYDMDYNVGLFTLGRFFSPIQERYKENKKVSEYIMNLKEDVLSNLDMFTQSDSDESDDILSAVMPFMSRKAPEEALHKYDVNLFVDNSSLEGAPVIVSYNPNYMGLVGEIEFDSEYGNYTTDFMKIMPGLLHKANGGYLILQLGDLLASPFSWETIKRVLKTGEIAIEPIKDYQFSGISITTLKPEPVKFTGKIIVVASGIHYELLREYDEEVPKLFKVSAFFDYEMNRSEENLRKLIGYIRDFSDKNDILPSDPTAITEIIKYSKRISGKKDKLTAVFTGLNEIITEADAIACGEGCRAITKEHIEKAVERSHERISLYEDKLDEMYRDGEMLIDVCGKKTGRINGLSVSEAYGSVFGRPTRITATTYMGRAGLVNIEKESELSGEIHTKGVQVITGYLGQKYAQDFPLCFSGRLCFEQSYGGIDGDSASSAEIYAIVSSLSDTPLRQDLAVTGSVNQFGEIQPVGGVTHKTEGFYDICKMKGFTGTQGVIIPAQNINELVLKDEILRSIKDGDFSIYAIETIDEGIELLTGEKAADVHKKAYEKLKSYYTKSKED